MARPTLTAQNRRIARRGDNRLYSSDIQPETPPVSTGGPYVAATVGDWVHGESVTISTDDVRSFGVGQGTVWLCDKWKYAESSVKVQQTVTAWSDTSITVTVNTTGLTSVPGSFLMVRDQNGNPVRFCNLEGRCVKPYRLGIGVNMQFLRYYNSYPTFANLAKHSEVINKVSGGSWGYDHARKKRAVINVDPGTVLKHLLVDPRSGITRDASFDGTYVVRWAGEAEVAWGTYGNALTSYYQQGDLMLINYPPAGNDDRGTLWYRNNTASMIVDFVRDVTVVKIDDFPGATNAEKAAAALASWDAGVANNDERMFVPEYISLLKDTWGVKGIRTMDWGAGHLERGATWDECDYTLDSLFWGDDTKFGCGRVPFAVHFALAKAVDAEVLHICIPARAQQDFYDGFFPLVDACYGEQLLAGKKLLLEVSNETWNFGGSWRIGAMLAGSTHQLGYDAVRCYLNTATGKYSCPDFTFDEPWFVMATDASTSNSFAIKTWYTTPSASQPARDLLIHSIAGGEFHIKNRVNNKNCTDAWVDVVPYQTQAEAQALQPTKVDPDPTTGTATLGTVKGQRDLKIAVDAYFSATKSANIPSFVPAQSTTDDIDRRMNQWNSHAFAALGPLEVLSIAHYYQDKGTSTYALSTHPDYLDLTKTWPNGVAWIDALSSSLLTADARPGSFRFPAQSGRLLDQPGRAYSGWGTQVYCYEGGNETGTGASVADAVKTIIENAANTAEGGKLMKYWLNLHAAAPYFRFVHHYVDLRDDLFGIRYKIDTGNPGRDALMIELQGEI